MSAGQFKCTRLLSLVSAVIFLLLPFLIGCASSEVSGSTKSNCQAQTGRQVTNQTFSKVYPVLNNHQAAALLLIGFGGLSVLLALLYVAIRKHVFHDADNLDTTFDAGGKVSTSLTAVTVASQLLWPGDLLQCATVAIKNGIAGSFWYTSCAVVNMILFPVLSVQFKTRAPGAKTFLQIIHARFGYVAHVVFCFFALLMNLMVTFCLLTASIALLQALVKDASGEYCVIIMATLFGSYSFVGGLGSTFYVSYFNTVIIFVCVLCFTFSIFYDNDDGNAFNAIDSMYDKVNCLEGPEKNEDRSYITFWSEGALIWAIQGFFATASITFCDQASWQSRIAAKPVQGVLGFFAATYIWFAIPSTIGTTLGLGYLALTASPNSTFALDTDDIDQGLVTVFMAQYEMGLAGSYLILTMLIMAVMSSGSGEVMAISSIIVYDIYQTHIRPFRSSDCLHGSIRNGSGRKLPHPNYANYGGHVVGVRRGYGHLIHHRLRHLPDTHPTIQVSSGLVTVFMAQYEMGLAGSYLILTMLIMAVMSSGSGEVMAISSIIVYDIYQTHIRPFRQKNAVGSCPLCGEVKPSEVNSETSDKQTMMSSSTKRCQCPLVSECTDCAEDLRKVNSSNEKARQRIYLCPFHGDYRSYLDGLVNFKSWCILWVTIGLLPVGMVILASGVDLNYVMVCGFILTTPSFPPALMAIIWSKTSALGVIVGSISGLVGGITANFITASTFPGGLSDFLKNTSRDYSVLAGSTTSFGLSLILTIVVSLMTNKIKSRKDELIEWQKARDIDNPLKPWSDLFKDDFPALRNGEKPSYDELDKVFRTAKLTAYIGGAISLLLFIVVIPATMATLNVLNKNEFRTWVIILQTWAFLMAAVVIVVVPVEETLVIYRQIRTNMKTSVRAAYQTDGKGNNSIQDDGAGVGLVPLNPDPSSLTA